MCSYETFRNRNKEYLKAKIDLLETNRKTKNIRDVYRDTNDFKKGFQPRTNIVRDEKGNFVTDSNSVSAKWKNLFIQIMNVNEVNSVRQTEIRTAELTGPEPNAFEDEMAIEKLKRHKSLGIDQLPVKLFKTASMTIRSEIHEVINSILNKEELLLDWKELVAVPNHKDDKRDCSNYRVISLLSTTYKTLSTILLSSLTPYADEIIGDHQYGSRRNRSTTDHRFCVRQILKKKWNTTKQCISYL